MVIQGRSHYSKNPTGIHRAGFEVGGGSGPVKTWKVSHEEMLRYFEENIPVSEPKEMQKSMVELT